MSLVLAAFVIKLKVSGVTVSEEEESMIPVRYLVLMRKPVD